MSSETQTQLLGIGSRVKHAAMGDGVVIRLHKISYEICFHTFGIRQVSKDYEHFEIIEAIEADEKISFSEAEKALKKVLMDWSDLLKPIELGDKWKDGILILKPSDTSLKPKEIPIETFFHKIVMVRDRIRVMEQRINSSKILSDEDKVNLQQYITRIYGSLTTFNVLFKYKSDHFVGEKSS